MRYSTIILAASALSVVTAAPISHIDKRVSKFKFFGVNESGAEFGSGKYPGVKGTDYIWPKTSTIDTLTGQGFNIFRIPFAMERLTPNSLTGSLDQTYLNDLKTIVNYITNTKGAYAIIDPQNFGRFNGQIITDTTGFGKWWKTVASKFSSNSRVIFDTNNEYHDMDQTLVFNLNQAAINAIRATGATSQMIFVEGNSYTGAWTWTQVNDNLKGLTDPNHNIIYEMHQYLDSDGSGTAANCVSSTIGRERVTSATSWLKKNGKKGILGEFAGGANSQCSSAIQGMLSYMASNTDVWQGALWWGGGPWWGNYIFSFEPPSGTAYSYYLSTLKKLF